MNLVTESTQGVTIVRLSEPKLMYPMLSEFSDAVSDLMTGGQPKVIVDMAKVVYIDSASIGCLMDLYRQALQAGGQLKLAGVQKRVETMLTMTGTLNFIQSHPSESDALSSFGE
jgi:anti-sigma B factor antagonist